MESLENTESKNSKTKTDKDYAIEFESAMKNWGEYYSDWAGCKNIYVGEDREIKGNTIYPESGDWVVNDIRGKSGTYGIDHESSRIYKVKLKNPEHYPKVDYKQQALKLKVDAVALMERYHWFSMLFRDWAHQTEVTPYGVWDTSDDIDKDYENEKTEFVNDPHLALYWLLHFGFSLDNRYEEVKNIVLDNQLEEQLEYFKMTLGFFNTTDAFYDLQIHDEYSYCDEEDSFENLFLRRRAYLVFNTQSYEFRGKEDNLQQWWLSIIIYPQAEKNMIKRMRWLKNNLKKHNKWIEFDEIIKTVKIEEISLLPYILACSPNTKDKTKHANRFLEELLDGKKIWKENIRRKFVQIMIWDLKDLFTEKDLLKKAVNFYFKGNTASKEYVDLLTVIGEPTPDSDTVQKILRKLADIFKDYDDLKTTTAEKERLYKKTDAIFSSLEEKLLYQVIENSNEYELSKRAFYFLYLNDLPNKQQTITQLFSNLGLYHHDIPEIFTKEFPHLIKDENDPNIEIVKSWFTLPESKFESRYNAEKAPGVACMFFLNVLHLPDIFNFVVNTLLLDEDTLQKIPHLSEVIFTQLLSEEYGTKINPTNRFNKEQIETMLENTFTFLEKNHSKIPGGSTEAIRTIYHCENPLAKNWIKEHHKSTDIEKRFGNMSIDMDDLTEEINDALESALEFIRDAEQNVYLEYKDEKSSKFWKIKYYQEIFTITYGKIGTKGQSKTKEFKDINTAHKEGKKLIEQKIKKGYISTTEKYFYQK